MPHDELMDEARRLADRLLQARAARGPGDEEGAARGRYLPWMEAVRFGETMRRVAAATEDATEGWTARRTKNTGHRTGKAARALPTSVDGPLLGGPPPRDGDARPGRLTSGTTCSHPTSVRPPMTSRSPDAGEMTATCHRRGVGAGTGAVRRA